MADTSVLVTAVLPMVGVVVGSGLQYWFSRASERRKQSELLRDQAYADYLRAVALAAHADHGVGSRHEEYLVQAAEAKARIAIYASKRVVEALARFERAGPSLDSEEGIGWFVGVCRAMRVDSSSDQRPMSEVDLRDLLFPPASLSSGEG
jgi:hypothetical protein